jgi:sugar lactone lactonase YvrE
MRCRKWRPLFFLLSLLVLTAVAARGQNVITTVAGSTWVFGGQGVPPTSAPLGRTTAVAVDAKGDVYASDQDNNLVVKISPSGILTVVAGNGIAGFSGDGGSATGASLYSPWGVAVDATGSLYIADQGNGRIRKVSPSGIISTVAGNGAYGFAGDGGPAATASLAGATGVAVDAAGNLYIADVRNNRIRKVNPAGVISTVAGNGAEAFSGDGGPGTSAALYCPMGVAVDAAGNLYIPDMGNGRIRKVNPSGIISTVAGNGTPGFSGDGGPATSAALSATGVAVDAAGDLYIADAWNGRIRKVSPLGIISTVAGNGADGFSGDGGPATSASLYWPEGVAVDTAGNLYIADYRNSRIRKVNPSGIISTAAGTGGYKFAGDGGPATSALLHTPHGVAVDAAGNLYVADAENSRIRKVGPSGIISTVAGNGAAGFSGDGGPAASAWLNYPLGVAVDAAGNLYIADTYNNRIRKVSPSGIISTVAGNGERGFSGDGGPAASAWLNYPLGAVVDAAGNLYIADTFNSRIRKVNPSGIISTVAGNGERGFSGDGGPATSALLYWPYGVAVDAAGYLYIADTYNNRIRKVGASGIISTVAGNGAYKFAGDGGPATGASLVAPQGVAVDAAGSLCIADAGNARVRKVSPSGIISTVAGNGAQGFSGDGGPATTASLNQPSGVAVDTAGNLFIADSRNDRIRKVAASSTAGGAPFEAQLTRFLNPGFYIVEATLAPGAAAGFWGLEVLTSVGQATGGFNLGGALHPSRDNTPGFGAFLLASAQTVTANLAAQVPSGTSLSMRFLDANKRQIGSPVSGPPPLRLGLSLSPGFYVVEVYNGASTPVTYQLGLAADFFSGGMDTGGYLGPGIVGFGAFYVPVAQNVTVRLFGQRTYGSAGAGSMVLTLRDSNRQILQVVGP